MQKRRFVAMALAFALVFSMFVGISTEPVSAATKKYEVPDKVIHYSNEATEDFESVENAVWKKMDADAFKYNKKGYVTKHYWNTKWTLKGSKRVKAKSGSKKQGCVSKSTYKKGKLKTITFTMYNKKGKSIGKGTETDSTSKSSKGWITKISGKKGSAKYTVTYRYKFYSNGLPKTIKETEKAYGGKYVRTYSFNSKGLVTKVKSKDMTTKYTYKYEGGKVVERYVYMDGFLMYRDKFVYSGKKTKDKKTFVGTINANDMEDVSSFVRDALAPAWPWLAK